MRARSQLLRRRAGVGVGGGASGRAARANNTAHSRAIISAGLLAERVRPPASPARHRRVTGASPARHRRVTGASPARPTERVDRRESGAIACSCSLPAVTLPCGPVHGGRSMSRVSLFQKACLRPIDRSPLQVTFFQQELYRALTTNPPLKALPATRAPSRAPPPAQITGCPRCVADAPLRCGATYNRREWVRRSCRSSWRRRCIRPTASTAMTTPSRSTGW